MSRYVVRLAAVTLGVAAAGVVVQPPAQAATCGSANGVSVVVDFHQLGGGVQSFCDAGGAGKYADRQFADAGHTLTYVQRQPGFVCRVDGSPSSDPCVNTPPADAYWSLWWSDGKSGTWTYSSSGVASLKVPAGGYVALSWQQGSAKAAPGIAPTAHPSSSPTPSPTTHPTRHPTRHPTQTPTSPSSSPPKSPGPVTSSSSAAPSSGSESATPSSAGPGKHAGGTKGTPSAHPRTKASADESPDAQGTDGAVPTEAGGPLDPTSGSSGSGGGGLPGWVAPVAVLLLFGAAGTVVVVRRRRSGGV